MPLRPYQIDGLNAIIGHLRQKQHPLYVLPTGGGKGTMIAEFLSLCRKHNKRAAFLVHRKELVEDIYERTTKASTPCGIVMAGHAMNRHEPIQICSKDSLVRRLDQLPPPDVVVVDEAHLSLAQTYRTIFDAWSSTLRVGFTATPWRMDGKGLIANFSHMELGPSISDLIGMGWLVKPRYFAHAFALNVALKGGDYDVGALGKRMSKGDIVASGVAAIKNLPRTMQGIAFAATVEQSMLFCEALNKAGISAAHLDGTALKHEREETIRRFKQGAFQVLCNCELFTTGFDVPQVGFVSLLRPTKSLSLALQMIGRGMRPAPGKDELIVLDHAMLHADHGLATDPREWSLEGLSAAQKKEQAKPKERLISFRDEEGTLHEAKELPKDGKVYDVVEIKEAPRKRSSSPQDKALREYYNARKRSASPKSALFALAKKIKNDSQLRSTPPSDIMSPYLANLISKDGWAGASSPEQAASLLKWCIEKTLTKS